MLLPVLTLGLSGLQFLSFTPVMNAWVGSFGADFNRPLLVATWGFGFVSAAALLIFTVMLMCWRDRDAERQLEALERVALSHSAPLRLPVAWSLLGQCSFAPLYILHHINQSNSSALLTRNSRLLCSVTGLAALLLTHAIIHQ